MLPFAAANATFESKNIVSDKTQKSPCPCGRLDGKGKALSYENCCGRYIEHWDAQPAPDAQSLMRSRYTAFVHENAAYLQDTWHSSQRPESLEFDAATKWLGLEIKSAPPVEKDSAQVEFVARYRVGGKAVRLHERSRFVREAGRWYYVDGDQF